MKHSYTTSDLHRFTTPCGTAAELAAWVEYFCGISVPRIAVCPGHASPFDYLRLAYFEPTTDLVVWAPRGGGKTRLAAAATLLDLIHKPNCSIRILGGSLAQSLRMWEHLSVDLEQSAGPLMKRHSVSRRVLLSNRSTAAVLPQSQRAVRGLRVQKLRCDEVELFDPQVWEAAQMVTRSSTDGSIAGAIEAISTFHKQSGLMSRIVDGAMRSNKHVIRWCLLEVLERCPTERECASCPLWDDCRGIAKTRCSGFFKIDDAIAIKQRTSVESWQSEMLCARPSVKGSVFPSFDPEQHVREQVAQQNAAISLAIDFGFNAPFVCLWVLDDGNTVFVIDEYLQSMRTTEEHIQEIESRSWGKVPRVCCDPAGAGRNDQTAESNVALLRRSGYKVHTRGSRILDGVEKIRALLRSGTGAARLFIHPRCVHLIKAMQSYHYPEAGGELPAKDGEHDHPIDALRYFLIHRGGGSKVRMRY